MPCGEQGKLGEAEEGAVPYVLRELGIGRSAIDAGSIEPWLDA